MNYIFLRNPTFKPFDCAKRAPIQFTGRSVMRYSKLRGQIVQYNETATKQVCDHLEAPPTTVQVKTRLNQELAKKNVDGWSENVTIVQTLTQDTIQFTTYAEATEEMQGQTTGARTHGQLISILTIIAAAVLVAVLAAVIITIAAFLWLLLSKASSVVERVRNVPTPGEYIDKFRDELGNVFNTLEEVITALKDRFWMVCPRCSLGFAPMSEFTTWESIPDRIKEAFNKHVSMCNGFWKKDDESNQYTTQIDCEAAGYYWYNDGCHSVPEEQICTEYLSKEECEAAGCYWWDGACHYAPKRVWPFPVLSRLAEYFPFLKKLLG